MMALLCHFISVHLGTKQLSLCHVGWENLHLHFVAISINSHGQTP